ncbi:NAD-dependent succinate-semialdehyde dehydrogenase [Pseudotabrizicola alkalilacus]|uniref:NAD-dependent succinate-semialdehyde dehydrogenase n=1 Tax=Pseudotabrizicola alkalilacus TaxID=2305252 RepID=A0A411Z0B1_9RHOB|nr:NAD-dependent succinate-semialdehyde dehydrogenase [Pseudotabrizicola alkalilacus]RGP36478.1 NAD-dependent succinate-semialdehyde dehydrogenase [Pseudotabrizicola alkalilacus]
MTDYPDLQLFIDNTWRKTADTLPVLNPATEQEIGRLPIARTSDLEDALAAAERGFRVWSRTAPRIRAQIILRAASLLREWGAQIAPSLTMENGKPLMQARMEVIRGAEFFEWDAGEAQRLYGHVVPSAPGIRYTVVREPAGIVAGFSPWNFPLSQPARKIAGALASGCSIILKAAEETPAGAIHIARAFQEAGLPAGVLNLVFGDPAEISSHLIPQDRIRVVAFTGSTSVGIHLTEMAARSMTPVLMELGGHAPVIVCDDVDAAAAGRMSAVRKARNSGQVCTSPTRFFVMEQSYEAFAQSFAERASQVRMGDGLNADTEMGPVANHRRIAALDALVEDARAKGAKVLCGGTRPNGPGYFFPVTVLAEVPDDARVMREEPFGPIAIINPVSGLDDAITRANALPFGLAAYGFTHSAANVDRLTTEIEAGNLSINTLEASVAEVPFGGVKYSGHGREGGAEGLHHYTVTKTISHRMELETEPTVSGATA